MLSAVTEPTDPYRRDVESPPPGTPPTTPIEAPGTWIPPLAHWGPPVATPTGGRRTALLPILVAAAALVVGVALGAVAVSVWANRDNVAATTSEIVSYVTEGDVHSSDLKTGMCFDEPDRTGDVGMVTARACDQPHEFQVFAAFDLDDADGPGPEVDSTSYDRCVEEWQANDAFAELSMAEQLLYYTPTTQGWYDGDRAVVCMVGGKPALLTEPLPVTVGS